MGRHWIAFSFPTGRAGLPSARTGVGGDGVEGGGWKVLEASMEACHPRVLVSG